MDSENARDLPTAKALATIERAVRFEGSLRSRTEGLTWIIWGLVCAATFLSYEATNALFYGDGAFAQDVDPHEQQSPWWSQALWVPWLLIGIAATYALWHSAALDSPGMAERKPRHVLILAAWIGFAAIGWLVAVVVFENANPSTYPIMGIGTAWILFGALNLYRGTARGRKVAIAIGLVTFLTGLLLAATLGQHGDVRYGALAGHLGAAATGLVPFLGGLWQTLRG